MKFFISPIITCAILISQFAHASEGEKHLKISASLQEDTLKIADGMESQVIAWRRHIH